MRTGILGVGELSEKIVTGLVRANPGAEIYLSPRSQQRAEALAARFPCHLMENNQAVVDAADLLIIGVRPHSLSGLAQEIRLRSSQTLVSLVAGVPLATLRKTFHHDKCARLMLTYAAEHNESTVVLTETDTAVQQLFAALGRPILLPCEQDFELATVSICMNGWFYSLADRLQSWFVSKGMQPAVARQLVLSNMQDCAQYAGQLASLPLAEMAGNIASEGTFTATGEAILQRQQAYTPWHNAAEAVLSALQTPEAE